MAIEQPFCTKSQHATITTDPQYSNTTLRLCQRELNPGEHLQRYHIIATRYRCIKQRNE